SYYVYLDFVLHFFVKIKDNGVGAKLLGLLLETDFLTINFKAFGFQRIRYLEGCNSTKYLSGFTGFGFQFNNQITNFSSQRFSILLQFGSLVRHLTNVLFD